MLATWLDEGRSLAWIGEQVGRSSSTVGYWVAKFGLEASCRDRVAARGGLERDVLEELVEADLTVREIAARVDRSTATVRHWLKRHGLETTRTARRGARDGAEGGRFEARCERHGSATFVIRSDGTSACTVCRSESVVAWRRRVKQRLIEEAGGSCALCGYAACAAALQFHHRDPALKLFGIGQRGLGIGWEKLRAEAAKCVLLCANCHAEVEAGAATLPLSSSPPRSITAVAAHGAG